MSTPYSHIARKLTFHKTILDIGSGPMMLTLLNFLKNNNHFEILTAVDKSEKNNSFINLLKKEFGIEFKDALKIYRNKFKFVQCDITTSEIPITDSYDIIILCNILHFLNKKKRSEVMNWCTKHLNKDGILFIRANHTANKEIINAASKKEFIDNEIRYSNEKGISFYLFNKKDLSFDLKQLKEQTLFYECTDKYFTAVFIKNND